MYMKDLIKENNICCLMASLIFLLETDTSLGVKDIWGMSLDAYCSSNTMKAISSLGKNSLS